MSGETKPAEPFAVVKPQAFVIPSAVTTNLFVAHDQGDGTVAIKSYPIIAWHVETSPSEDGVLPPPCRVIPIGVGGLLLEFPDEVERIYQIVGSQTAAPTGYISVSPSVWMEKFEKAN
jgi:hypothetical protein